MESVQPLKISTQQPAAELATAPDLVRVFMDWNLRFFEGRLPVPVIRWNSRLRTSAGRFMPSYKKSVIEIASYLLEEQNAEALIRDTMGHEMIHYWLWVMGKPYGHTTQFHEKMQEMQVSRYNPVPRHRPFKHCYVCQQCELKIWTRKRLKAAACAACCNQHSQGKYHPQFKLKHVSQPDQAQNQPKIALKKRA